MEIKKLDYDALSVVKPYFDQFNCEISDINLTNLYMWREKYNFHYLIFESFLYIVNIKGDKRYFSQPIGNYENSQKIIDSVKRMKELYSPDFVIKKASESFAKLIGETDIIFDVRSTEDEQDYIYDFDALRMLSGKKYHKKKNHVNKFLKTYPDWQFAWFAASDFQDVTALLYKWIDDKDLDDPNYVFERDGIIDILTHRERFDLKIGVLRVSGSIVGFIIGEIINSDMLIVHIEKADTAFDGVFTMIGHAFYNELNELKWINREQDLGIEGLRKSKQSYFPARYVEKMEMWFR